MAAKHANAEEMAKSVASKIHSAIKIPKSRNLNAKTRVDSTKHSAVEETSTSTATEKNIAFAVVTKTTLAQSSTTAYTTSNRPIEEQTQSLSG